MIRTDGRRRRPTRAHVRPRVRTRVRIRVRTTVQLQQQNFNRLDRSRPPVPRDRSRKMAPRGQIYMLREGGSQGASSKDQSVSIFAIFATLFSSKQRLILIIISLRGHTSLMRHTPIDAWEQCNHTRKNELNRYLVHALEQPPIYHLLVSAERCQFRSGQPQIREERIGARGPWLHVVTNGNANNFFAY